MSTRPTFKEYCSSKDSLRLAADNVLRVTENYTMRKYCKFPVIAEEADDTEYVALKPKDIIEVVLEYLIPDNPTVVSFKVESEEDTGEKIAVRPSWGNKKLVEWLDKNATK